MLDIEQELLNLIAIAQKRKPGQVTHKIEEIKQFVVEVGKRGEEKAANDMKSLKEDVYNLPAVRVIDFGGERLELISKYMVASCINIYIPDHLKDSTLKKSQDKEGNI